MFVFVDIETTGLDPARHVILEIAALICDEQLNEIDSKSFVIQQDAVVIDKPWIAQNHGQLISECMSKGSVSLGEADMALFQLIRSHTKGEQVPICGNSVHFDRKFLERHVPEFMELFNHRNIDVSSFREAFKMIGAEPFVVEKVVHRALEDCRSSAEQLRYYLACLQKS